MLVRRELSCSARVRCPCSDWLLVNNVAKRLNLSRRTVRHLAKTGKLPARRIRVKIWQFRAADVEEFKARREGRHV